MEISDHINTPAAEGQLPAAAAREAGTGAPVPTCPDRPVRDLLRHTGKVHRWATAFAVEGHTSYHPDGKEPDLDGPQLPDWFRAGHGLRVATAEELRLTLWTRLPLTAVTVTGAPEPARLRGENSGVTWS
ncbi:hypothetical protein ACF08M_15485 [Streptomyces sp. NPDC015032]|uniref:hypothetical protein n=1 Tax=Streptomyces sp. NPDC015032 TaxID=3364937 RepID=UPI0036FCC957